MANRPEVDARVARTFAELDRDAAAARLQAAGTAYGFVNGVADLPGHPALRRVSVEIASSSLVLAEELTLTTAELSYLAERRQAYDNLSARTGLEAVKSVMTALNQAERYGTPIGSALRVLSQESRDMRMNAAEKKAARANPPRIWVQVAGGANERDLAKAYAAVKAKAPTVFAGRQAWTTPLRATNRVLAGPFKTDAEARGFVNQLGRNGVSAFTFSSDQGQVIAKLPAR